MPSSRSLRLVLALVLVVLVAIGAAACSPKANPKGVWDAATLDSSNRLEVYGWAFDPDLTGPVLIEAREGATVLASQRTGLPLRGDVAAAFPGQTDDKAGFRFTTPALAVGTHEICLWAKNRGIGSGDTQLGCRAIDTARAVALVGDSLGVGVEAGLRTKIVATWPASTLESRVQISTPLSYAVEGITQYKSTKDIIVVSSGANNLLSPSLATEVRTALAATSGAACVVWPTVSERIYQDPAFPPTYGTPAQWVAGAKLFNTTLRTEAAKLSNVHVADWAPIVTATPGYTGTDGLHHSGTGNTAFATLLMNTIVDDC